MDRISMDSFFFEVGGQAFHVEDDVFETVHMSTLERGVCTKTEVTYQTIPYFPNTRDGYYQLSEDQCDF